MKSTFKGFAPKAGAWKTEFFCILYMYFSKTTSKSTKTELQKNAFHAKNKLNPARNENWPQKVTCTLFLHQSLCITNHLMTGPFGKSEFCFPRISVFLETKSRDTLRFDSLFPSGPVIKYICYIAGVFPATACAFIG